MSNLVKIGKETFNLTAKTFEEAMSFSKLIADSSICPPQLRGKPGDVLVAVQLGQELGLHPMQAIQSIAVINNRAVVWGDAMLALVKSHPDFVNIDEWLDGTIAYCTVTRRNQEPQTRSFSMDQAKTAGLAGKAGPWTQYPTRMLQMRARGFAIRDVFPDAIKGLITREEAEDMRVIDMEAAAAQKPSKSAPKGIEALKAKVGIASEPEVIQKADSTDSLVLEITSKLQNAKTEDDLALAVDLLRELPEENRESFKELYKTKMKEIKNANTDEAVG